MSEEERSSKKEHFAQYREIQQEQHAAIQARRAQGGETVTRSNGADGSSAVGQHDLPSGWERHVSRKSGRVYYYCPAKDQSMWPEDWDKFQK